MQWLVLNLECILLESVGLLIVLFFRIYLMYVCDEEGGLMGWIERGFRECIDRIVERGGREGGLIGWVDIVCR